MKFGARLEGSVRPMWSQYYVDYKSLKKSITADDQAPRRGSLACVLDTPIVSPEGVSLEPTPFLVLYQSELDKVERFFQQQLAEVCPNTLESYREDSRDSLMQLAYWCMCARRIAHCAYAEHLAHWCVGGVGVNII